MRIVFMGTPEFALPTLKKLVNSEHQVVGVITAADKAAGRGKKVQFSAVKKMALEFDLPILQPSNLKDPTFINELAALKADIQIVVAFRMLPESVWSMPPKGTFNLHSSLLPLYRGAAPMNYAIKNGETKTGVTTFLLDQKIDTGKIMLQKSIPINENDNVGDIHDQLMIIGADLVMDTIAKIEDNSVETIDQSDYYFEEEKLPTASKLQKKDFEIDWSKSCQEIHNHIRSLSPYPGAFTKIVKRDQNMLLKIYETIKTDIQVNPSKPFCINENKDLLIACKDYYLQVNVLQLEGKKRMKTSELINGFDFLEAKLPLDK